MKNYESLLVSVRMRNRPILYGPDEWHIPRIYSQIEKTTDAAKRAELIQYEKFHIHLWKLMDDVIEALILNDYSSGQAIAKFVRENQFCDKRQFVDEIIKFGVPDRSHLDVVIIETPKVYTNRTTLLKTNALSQYRESLLSQIAE